MLTYPTFIKQTLAVDCSIPLFFNDHNIRFDDSGVISYDEA